MKTGSNQFLGNALTDRDCPTDFSRQESTQGSGGHANARTPYTHVYGQTSLTNSATYLFPGFR